VTLAAVRTLTAEMVRPTASSEDYDLYLYNSSCTQLAKSENAGTTEQPSCKNTGTTTKTLYINVRRYLSNSSVTPYILTLTR